MNSFPRHSQFQGHLIGSLPNLYVCSECHWVLIYACGDENETVTCAKDYDHVGLIDRSEVVFDPIPLLLTRRQQTLGIQLLFGDDE
jgi:hypothetical protein